MYSDDEFGWISVKKEPKFEELKVKKKKKHLNESCINVLDSTEDSPKIHCNGEYVSAPNKVSKKRKLGNDISISQSPGSLGHIENISDINTSLISENTSLNGAHVSFFSNGERKQKSKEKKVKESVSIGTFCGSDLDARKTLLDDSDTEVKNKSLRKTKIKSNKLLKDNLTDDLVAKDSLLYSDSEVEVSKKKKKNKAHKSSLPCDTSDSCEQIDNKIKKEQISLVSSRKRKLDHSTDENAKQQLLHSDLELESEKNRKPKILDEAIFNLQHSNISNFTSEVTIAKVQVDKTYSKTEIADSFEERQFIPMDRIQNEIKHEVLQAKTEIKNSNDYENFVSSNIYSQKPTKVPKQSKKQKSLFVRATLESYLSEHKNLTPETISADSNLILEPDDDIWIFSCPRSLPFDYLRNLNLKPDGKTKLRSEDTTFECVMSKYENDNNTVNVVTHSDIPGVCNIQTKVVKGTIKITEKLPKHTDLLDGTLENVNENTVEENENVQFPEVKTRHPFFGPEYKQSITINTKVAKKLKKAKSRRKKKNESVTDNNVITEYTVLDKKVAKKWKPEVGNCSEYPSPRKQIKEEIESDNQWESAQSIEKTLFDISHITANVKSHKIKKEIL